MNKDWFTLIEKHTLAGARDKFENICGSLFKKVYPGKNGRNVEVNPGDGGIDVFIGEIGLKPIHVIQCKFFPTGLGDSQKAQIINSFKTAIESKKYEMTKWSLCIPSKLNIDENI
ncbi:restriction endonuclease [Kordia jejudonensis]|uniref:restriction endonuclease n=1 Tax=Kordia jejudonensis TaxID=1348245 RepID=UPI000699640D|nr:restriction endonuclease [Kordia jejudonensis]